MHIYTYIHRNQIPHPATQATRLPAGGRVVSYRRFGQNLGGCAPNSPLRNNGSPWLHFGAILPAPRPAIFKRNSQIPGILQACQTACKMQV